MSDPLQTVTDEVTRAARTIRALTERSEGATAAALDSIEAQLRAITSDARRSITGMRAGLAASSGPDDQTEISRAFDNQQKAARAYVIAVDRICDQQHSLAAASVAAVEECSAIIEAGQAITTVSRASRLLSLNAATSAARIGARGAAVGVIAHQMQNLSDEIQEVNRDLQGLVTTLMGLLPKVVHQAEAIRSASRTFSEQLSAKNAQLAGDTGALDDALRASMDDADARLRTILGASRRALSELSFRGRFNDHLSSMRRDTEALAGRVGHLAGTRPSERAAAEVELPEMTGAADSDISAGELMLF